MYEYIKAASPLGKKIPGKMLLKFLFILVFGVAFVVSFGRSAQVHAQNKIVNDCPPPGKPDATFKVLNDGIVVCLTDPSYQNDNAGNYGGIYYNEGYYEDGTSWDGSREHEWDGLGLLATVLFTVLFFVGLYLAWLWLTRSSRLPRDPNPKQNVRGGGLGSGE